MRVQHRMVAMAFMVAWLAGCSASPPEKHSKAPTDSKKSAETRSAASPGREHTEPDSATAEAPGQRFQPVALNDAPTGPSGAKPLPKDAERQMQSVVAALQPFQILLGKWRWTTKKQIGGFAKTGEDMQWIWDFQTDRTHPALTFHSDKHPYVHQVWLSYDPDKSLFRLTCEPTEGAQRMLEGTWMEGGEPADVILEGKRPDRTYKLELVQVSPAEGDQWRVVVNQQENNRFLMEWTRRPASGNRFGPLDTVAQQRLGTSFAVADSDNPGPKCIISGGLGTMSVSYKGKTYPVCCTGCAAAFNEDPERWLAKLAAKDAPAMAP